MKEELAEAERLAQVQKEALLAEMEKEALQGRRELQAKEAQLAASVLQLVEKDEQLVGRLPATLPAGAVAGRGEASCAPPLGIAALAGGLCWLVSFVSVRCSLFC